MATLGALEIQLLADVSRLRADMGQATGIVSSTSQKMSEGFGMVSKALAAVGVGLSVAGFANWIKSAINAADEMSKFSTKTGIATKDVAGLQLAFKLGGVGAEAMGASMSRMTREMAKGNDAFGTLGVATRNVDGSLRSTKDVLFDTADALSTVKGDTERSALAMQIFGKSGAELLPVFANGSEGLREMADMADKLGLSLDGEAAAAAEKFNDTLELVGMSTQGVGRQVAAQLLPALNGIVGAFLSFITEGDRVKRTADVIASGLKILYSAGVAIVQVFSTVGKTVGAVFAQIVAIMQGDFKRAITVGDEWVKDMKTDWTGAIKNIGDAWEGTSADTTQALAATTKSMRDVKIATDSTKESQKEAARQAREDAKEAEKIQKEKAKLLQEEIDLQSKRAIAVIAAYEKEEAAIDASLGKAGEMVEAIERQTAQLKMSNSEREISNALLALEKAGLEEGTYAYDVYAEKIRAAIVERETVAKSIESAKQISEEWNKLTEQIGQSLSDTLFAAFESGKGFFKTFWDGLVNTFKTTTLRLLIDAVMRPVNGAIGGALGGLAGTANAGTGAGGAGGFGGILSGLGSIGSMLSGAGGLFSAGMGMTMSGGFGSAMGAAGAALGNGSILGGLSIGAGALAPFAAGAAAIYGIYQALKKERTPHSGGAAMSTATGGAATTWAGVTGLGARNFDVSDQANQGMQALSQSIAQVLQPLADMAGAGMVKVGTAYADDKSSDPAWGALRILAGNRSLADWGGTQNFADGQAGYEQFIRSIATSTRSAIDSLKLPEWARKITRELKDGATLDDIAKAVEQIRQMGEAQKLLSNLSRFGGIFSQVAGSSIEAQKALVDLMGGIDGLTSAAGTFVQQYYTEAEQAAIQARQVVDALKGAGVDVGNLRTKEDYRYVLETINPTEENMKRVAALLQNAGAAAQLFDYLGTNKDTIQERTLVQLAAGAPKITSLESMMQAQAVQAPDVVTAVDNNATAVSEAIDALKTDMKTLLEGIASSSAATARQLQTWDDGGALSTVTAV